MAITFTPFVANTVVSATSMNNSFSPLYSLLGYTGSPGLLTEANFGLNGVNASQINVGSITGSMTNVSGNVVNALGSFMFYDPVVGPPGEPLLSYVFSNTNRTSGSFSGIGGSLIFCGTNEYVWLEYNNAAKEFLFSLDSWKPGFNIRGGTVIHPTTFGCLAAAFDLASGSPLGLTTHAVYGQGATDGSGNVTVNLSSPAAFTNASSYQVFFTAEGSSLSVISSSPTLYITYNSGSQFVIVANLIAGTLVNWVAIGT